VITNYREYTVEELCKGFEYSDKDGKGLFGLDGKLTIQPDYQRHFLYEKEGLEQPVIQSLLRGFPLGVLYFNQVADGSFEVLDGQQRITSIGRFLLDKFFVLDDRGREQYFSSLPEDKKDLIKNSRILAYHCQGEESEIKDWFEVVNKGGLKLTTQEVLNAVYSGPFITEAKKIFSNGNNTSIEVWATYLAGDFRRQAYLETAFAWAAGSKESIESYLGKHRLESDISSLVTRFDEIIDWVSSTFLEQFEPYMKGLDWGNLWMNFAKAGHDPQTVTSRVRALIDDPYISSKRGVFEYVLGGEQTKNLLGIRVFSAPQKQRQYDTQAIQAKRDGISNCPHCVIENSSNKAKIWPLSGMEADHVSAWSKGGESIEENCQMLCMTHNRLKGNN
jgi:5-methylcytosine-specific restriction endonuclease McrA